MDMEGIASIALLPSGSISGHFIPHYSSSPSSANCFALYGTEIQCERECSRGDDYRLIKLNIFDYLSKSEEEVIVECRGHDAARFANACDVNGWEEDVLHMVERNKKRDRQVVVSFECTTLKAGKDAEMHVKRYLPHLMGCDVVVNVGAMIIQGLDFSTDTDKKRISLHTHETEDVNTECVLQDAQHNFECCQASWGCSQCQQNSHGAILASKEEAAHSGSNLTYPLKEK